MHSADGEKRGAADAESLLASLLMQVVVLNPAAHCGCAGRMMNKG